MRYDMRKIGLVLIFALLLTACTETEELRKDYKVSENKETEESKVEEITKEISNKGEIKEEVKAKETEIEKKEEVAPKGYMDMTTGYWGLKDINGKIIVEAKWLEEPVFSEGLASVADKERKIGYIDYRGAYVIEPKNYRYGRGFSEGLAAVGLNEGNFPQLSVYIDKKGDVVLGKEQKIVNAGEFKNGYAVCDILIEEGNWDSNIIDKKGNKMLKEYYDYISYYEKDNIYIALNNNGMRVEKKVAFISAEFKVLAEFKGPSSVVDIEYGKQFFSEDGYGIINDDWSKQIAINKRFEIVARGNELELDRNYIIAREYTYEGYEIKDIVTKFYNYKGEVKYTCKRAKAGTFELYGYERDGKWGYLDKALVERTEAIYEYVDVDGDRLQRVMINGKYGYMGEGFKMAIEPKYDNVGRFYNGVAPVIENGKFYFINEKNERIEISSEEKLKYLERAKNKEEVYYLNEGHGDITNLPYLFIDDKKEKIEQYLQTFHGKTELPMFENYGGIPAGGFIAPSIIDNIMPNLDFTSYIYEFTDIVKSADMIFGEEIGRNIKLGNDYLFYEEDGKIRLLETSTMDYTYVTIVSISESNNIYEVIYSDGIVDIFDNLSLYTKKDAEEYGEYDFELSKKVLYFDMPDEEAINSGENVYYSKYQIIYEEKYDEIIERGEKYIIANPEKFNRYKMVVELRDGMFKIIKISEME